MKKILTFIIVLILSLFLVQVKTYAIEGTDDTGKATYTATQTSLKGITNYSGCILTNDYGKCLGKDVHVALLTQNCNVDTNNSKLVTWAIPNSDGSNFTKGNVAKICENYEKTHPGWLVMGGINSDQYTLGFGTGLGADGKHPFSVQPYYPLICDGEKWFSNTWFAGGEGSNGNFVGITNRGELDPLNRVQASSAEAKTTFTCQILDEYGDVIATYPVDSLNGSGDTVVYAGMYSDTNLGTFVPGEPVSANLFIVENAELAYVNNSSTYTKVEHAQDAFFGKGTITKKDYTATLGKGQFAIATKNPELLEKLDIGVRIRCQYEYIDQTINSYESGVGFHTIQRDNNVDLGVSGAYNTNSRPRAIIGRQSSGTLALMVIDDYKDSYGTTGYGINAICKAYGIVEAYQMDGGGSAQMAIRTDEDTFKSITHSADYAYDEVNTNSQRSVFEALLFVVRDPATIEPDKVEYILNGGSVGAIELETTYESYRDLTLPTPVKDGYIFDGWYLDSDFQTKVHRKVKGDIKLYAHYLRLGDMNNDDELDLLDCILMRIYYSSGLYDEYKENVFDYNGNNIKDEDDITKVQEKIIE